MTARIHIALFLAVLLGAWGASAKVYVEWRPRMSVAGGYDDNVQMVGNGGDGFGQATPGVKLDLFGEHDLHLDLDCQAGLARLAHPEEFGLSERAFAANESCALGTKVKLDTRDKLTLRTMATYAQDPFAIAGLGLLLRPGQSQVFVGKFSGEVEHALSGRSQFDYGLDAQALAFGAGDPGNSFLIAPQVKYAYRSTPRGTWDLGLREQLFFGVGAPPNTLAPKGAPGGLLDTAHTGLLGYTYALTPWADIFARGGGAFVTSVQRDAVTPIAQVGLESYTPTTAVSVVLKHDLTIGPSSAGPIIADIAELGLVQQWEHLGGHLRIGMYRNETAFDAWSTGAIGWGGEIGADWSFTQNLKLGIAAMRDARIYDPTVVAAVVDRDVVQVRLTWEKARFE